VGARFSASLQTGPGAHPASSTMGTGSFPGVKSGRGVTLTPHPLLVPWSGKSRVIPLLLLWALRPAQSVCLYKGALYLTFTARLRCLIPNWLCYCPVARVTTGVGVTKRAICDTCLFSGNAQKPSYYYTAQINPCYFTAYQCNRICCENLRQRGVYITVY